MDSAKTGVDRLADGFVSLGGYGKVVTSWFGSNGWWHLNAYWVDIMTVWSLTLGVVYIRGTFYDNQIPIGYPNVQDLVMYSFLADSC